MSNPSWKAVERLRLDTLNELFNEIRHGSPFYQHKLAAWAGTKFSSLDELEELPLTDKRELQAGGRSYVRHGQRPHAYFESSGTTGAPLAGYPDLSFQKSISFGAHLDQWMGLKLARVELAAVALGFEMSPVGARFQQALQSIPVSVIPLGVRSTMCTPMRSVDVLLRTGPQAIFSRPLELLRYGDVIQDVAPHELDMQKVFFLGEVMSEGKCARIRRVWNDAHIYGHYGLTELDTGLQTCDLGNYHEPDTPFVHVELLRLADDSPIKRPGERGQLVVSTLRNSVAPLLRYKTADVAQRVSCGCGLYSPAYRIFGRIVDEARIGHRTLFPCELENMVLGVPQVGNEFQFVLEPEGRLTIRLEVDRGHQVAHGQLAANVRARLPQEIEAHVDIEVHPYGCLADKLGIAKKKSGQFVDLRRTDPAQRAASLAMNVIDSQALEEISPRSYPWPVRQQTPALSG